MASHESDDGTIIIEETRIPIELAVKAALPNISSEKLALCVENLMSVNVGVKQAEDLAFVEISDLSILSPIEARKCINAWKSSEQGGSTRSSTPSLFSSSQRAATPISPSQDDASSMDSSRDTFDDLLDFMSTKTPAPGNRQSSPSTSPEQSDLNWDRVPKRIKPYFEKGERLPSSLRNDLIRFIIDDIHTGNMNMPYPRTAQLRIVASKVVAKYPKSLKDTIDGEIVGSGYDSLLSQLVNRVDNLSRPQQNSMKRKLIIEEGKHPKKISVDSYGCVRWQCEMPVGQTKETQNAIKENLKDRFNNEQSENEDVSKDVSKDMMSVYATLRKDINADKSLNVLLQDWPYLFKVPYIFEHFQHLIDIDIVSRMTTNIGGRVPKIIRYFDANDAKVAATLKDVKDAMETKEDETPQIVGLLLLLADYFGEKDAIVFAIDKDIETTVLTLPAYPCLVAHGKPLTATLFTLVFENKIIMTEVTNPVSAISAWFAIYYILNLKYPEGQSNVLEFVQRAILGINPEGGCKRTKNKGKKPSVSPAVLKLTTALSNFENEFCLF